MEAESLSAHSQSLLPCQKTEIKVQSVNPFSSLHAS